MNEKVKSLPGGNWCEECDINRYEKCSDIHKTAWVCYGVEIIALRSSKSNVDNFMKRNGLSNLDSEIKRRRPDTFGVQPILTKRDIQLIKESGCPLKKRFTKDGHEVPYLTIDGSVVPTK